tara:strand:- start:340 stop:726 length:387 start_codon:yes stop_codon:yes gene_type:complete
MLKRITVVAGIIIQKDLFLIARRSPHFKGSGFWEFPGGKLEIDETKEMCLKRELDEELEIKVIEYSFYKSYDYSSHDIIYNMNFYLINKFSGTIKLNAHDKIKWIKYNEFRKYDMLPGDIPIIKDLGK